MIHVFNPFRHRRAPLGAAAVIAFFAAAFFLGVGGWQIMRSRDATLKNAEQNIRNLTRSLAQHAARTIEAVDLTLTGAVEEVGRHAEPDELSSYLRRRDAALDQVRNFVMIGADGTRIADSVASDGPLSSADRSYFQWHRDHPGGQLHVDEVIVDRTSSRPGLPVSRRIDNPDGSFGGVVIATLAPEHFESFYRSVRTGERGTVALWTEDGHLLLRYPAAPEAMRNGSPQATASAAKAFKANAGVERSRSPWDGIERLFAFEHVGNFPLVVSAAVSVEDALADWYQSAVLEGLVVGGAVVFLLLMGFGLEVRRRRILALQMSSRDADRRYRLLASASSDMIQLLDLAGQRRYVSPAAAEIFGYAPDEMVGTHPADFILPSDAARVRGLIDDLVAGARDQARSLHRIRHAVGHSVWVEAQFRLVRDEATGAPAEVVSSVRDVSVGQDLRHRMSEANRQLRMAEEVAHVGHWRVQLPANVLTWSDEIYRIHGRDPATFFPCVETAISAFHPEDRAEAERCMAEAIGARRNFEFALRILRPDGHVRHVLSRGLCETDSSGDVTAVFGTIMDVTELREAERAAVASEARYRLLADNATDMITQMDLDCRRTFVSNGSRELLGYDPVELIGTDPQGFVHPDDAPGLKPKFDDLAAGKIDHAINVNRVRHKDGRWIWVEATVKLLRAVDGRPSGLVSVVRNIMERRLADEALRESEARYRLLSENTTDMITHMDLDGRRLFVSPGSRELLGYEPNDLVGTSPQGMIHPDEAAGLQAIFDDLAAGSRDRAVTVNRLRHKDGRWIWVEASLKLLRDEAERPAGFVGAIRNIMDRKLTEEALRESEGRYRLLADHSSDLIALKPTYEGPRAYVSPSSRTVVGYEPAELASLPASDYVHPEDQARVAAEFASLSVEHPEVTSVHRVKHKAGHWIWIETGFRLINANQPDRTVIVRARDVTRRREVELALAASEKRYRILAETTSDVITQLDLSMRRQYVSPSCRQLLGYEPDEMLGAQPSTTMHPDDAGEVRGLAARLAAGEIAGDKVMTTYRTRHKNGRWVWVEAVLNLLRDEETGAPLSLICSLRDVTERQRAARHLERAKAIAEQAARAKAEFLANMSHELRTPLTGILGVHDLLRQDRTLGDGQRRLVGLAADAGNALLAIVNDVLDFSKIEAGQLTIEAVPFDLEDLVASCVELAARGLNGKPVELRTDFPTAIPRRLVGDPTRLRQVLLNLLTNAVKFTDSGQVVVAVEHRSDAGMLRIEVADTGIGVPPDRMSILFDRFTQADTSMTRRYGGTGLGLAICKRLVELMDGRIGVKAAPTGGAAFWFEVAVRVDETTLADQSAEELGAGRAAGGHLLLAEDNAINAEIIAAMLAARGYRVTTVPDGAAAVAAARGRPGFDLALIDLQMPVMDGLAAAAAIRAEEAIADRARLPIVGLTANALAEDVTLCLAAGMDAHVPKPVVWPDLFTVIERLVGKRTESALSILFDEQSQDLELSRLEELASIIGRDRLAGILGRFASDLPLRLAAIDEGSDADIARQTHMLAAMAGQLGFRRLSSLCFRIEEEARDGLRRERVAELRNLAEGAARLAARSSYARVA